MIVYAEASNFRANFITGRLEGFRKILLLLVYHDVDLTREILKTFKRFLDIRRQGELQSSLSGAGLGLGHFGSAGQGSSHSSMKKSISVSSFGEFARQKIGSVGRLLFTEFHKMFSQQGPSGPRPLEHPCNEPNRAPVSSSNILLYHS